MAVNRGAAYLAGTSRSVGKGWPSGHLLPDQLKARGIEKEVTLRRSGRRNRVLQFIFVFKFLYLLYNFVSSFFYFLFIFLSSRSRSML